MKTNRMKSWLNNIYHTQDQEISCSQCFDLVSGFVDLELSGVDAVSSMPAVKNHLDQCTACRDEYENLRDFRQLEDQGAPPSTDDLKKLIP